MCWSIIRATSCSRSTRTRSTSFALAILQLDERPRVRVLARRDRFDRFVSVLVFVPRERYDSAHPRARSATIWPAPSSAASRRSIRSSRKGRWCACTSSSAAPAAPTPEVDRATLEHEVAAIVRTWTDGLERRAGAGSIRRSKARALFNRYRDAFSAGFHDAYAPAVAASDIRVIEGLTEQRPLGVDFHHRLEEEQRAVGLKVWSLRAAAAAVGARAGAGKHGLPRGRRAHLPHRADRRRRAGVWFHDMLLERARRRHDRSRCRQGAAGGRLPDGDARRRRERRLQRADARRRPGLARRGADPHAVALPAPDPRALFAGLHVGDAGQACRASPPISSSCSTPVSIRAPTAAQERDAKQSAIAARIEEELQKVESLDEDRILRHFVNAVQSAIRTNFYQTDKDGQPKALIAVKFESGKLDRPAAAAPALRDFRLFAARRRRAHALRQGGARRHPLVRPAAGFPHRDSRPGEGAAGQERGDRAGRRQGRLRAQADAEGRARATWCRPKASRPTSCSSRRCSTSPTISTATAAIIPPDCVVRHEGDDPYLVVAADKGTATFSDIANAISIEHDYWLGDAFASGGSAGYDHKVMGITARGAWEAVKRHFREMDVNIGKTPFTAVGVGDMSGDVFGNGMLREKHHPAAGGVRSSRHLHRSRSRSGEELRRAQAAVRAAALELAGLRQDADFQGRRRLSALVEGNPAQSPRRRSCSAWPRP